MRLDAFGAIIKAALLAGLAAGLVVAAVQFVWSEPVIDRAIVLEEQLHAVDNARANAAQPPQETPVVDRPTQKKGLFLGYTIYGLAWGLLFGAAYAIAQPHLSVNSRLAKGVLLAGVSFWAVGLLPFLKYPANPPGVGDPETIDFRQHIYLGMLVGGIAVVALGLAVHRALLARRGRWTAVGVALGAVALGSAALYAALPSNPDVVHMPAGLVADFRMHSLAGLALFWLVLGGVFGPVLSWLSAGVRRPALAGPSGAS